MFVSTNELGYLKDLLIKMVDIKKQGISSLANIKEYNGYREGFIYGGHGSNQC